RARRRPGGARRPRPHRAAVPRRARRGRPRNRRREPLTPRRVRAHRPGPATGSPVAGLADSRSISWEHPRVSKYLEFPQLAFKDRRLLLAALADLGYAEVEEGEALPLYGYQGDRREG